MAFIADEDRPGKDNSPGTTDPMVRLAQAVVIRSITDLCSDDTIKALDALAWWLSDGPLWLDAFIDPAPPADVALAIILKKTGGRRYAKYASKLHIGGLQPGG